MEILLTHESTLRLTCFVTVLLAMMIWERRRPRRVPGLPRWRRWGANLAVVVVDSVLLRLTLPLLAVGAAALAQARGWGLFNWLDAPVWLAFIASLLLLDLVIYAQHVAFHKIPLCWRLHRMHHTDTDFDVTTALRFHPFEIVLSMLIKLAVVTAAGAPPAAVVLFEIILNATAMFNHSNIQIPAGWDRRLRLFVVTPDMHRVHHSIDRLETDSNFGFNLPWWDRLFGTYRDQPQAGHQAMTLGLDIFRDRRSVDLHWLLLQPFLHAQTGQEPKHPPATDARQA